VKKRAANRAGQKRQLGITLVEVLISMMVLSLGLVGMLSVMAVAIKATQGSEETFIAKTIADEAMESILTARETANIPWASIANTGSGGIFLSGFQPCYNSGADGIYGTADDAASGEQTLQLPGPDGIFGTADDIFLALTNYQRQIQIQPALNGAGLPIGNLNTVTITVQYLNPQFDTNIPQTYTLSTFISPYR
jgi:type IV pilus modification protein PilV